MSHSTRACLTRLLSATAVMAGVVLTLAQPATAHVRVISEATPGQPATLQFRVPSELADATTVRVVVAIPPELSVVSVPPVDGWTEKTVSGAPGQVTRLVWTAQPGRGIKPDDHVSFTVSVGPLPDRRSVSFDTEQTYSNGMIASWNQDQDGDKEPPYPAPVLVINPAAPPSPAGGEATSKSANAESGTRVPSAAAISADPAGATQEGVSARLLGVIGAAVVAAAAIGAALVRRRGNNYTSRP